MSNFADIVVVPTDGAVFGNTRKGDLTIFTESGNQNVHIGPFSSFHAPLSVASSAVRVGTSIIPSVNKAYDLGTSNARFRDIYLSDTKITTSIAGDFELCNSNNRTMAVFKKPDATTSNYFVFDPQLGSIQLYNSLTNQLSYPITGVESGTPGLSNVPGIIYSLPGSNLGIGTSNPESLMHVAGNARIDGELRSTRIKIFQSTE